MVETLPQAVRRVETEINPASVARFKDMAIFKVEG
jgi:hypothetical protein